MERFVTVKKDFETGTEKHYKKARGNDGERRLVNVDILVANLGFCHPVWAAFVGSPYMVTEIAVAGRILPQNFGWLRTPYMASLRGCG